MIIAESNRIILRHFESKDLKVMTELFTDPGVMKYSDGILAADSVVEWMQKFVPEHYESYGYGPLAVEEKETEKIIGYCALQHFPDIDGKAEIELGYRLLKKFWGRGYATEAAILLRDYAGKTLGIERLISLIAPENAASIRVAKKLGMTLERKLMLDGVDHPDYLFSTQFF